MRPSCDRNSTIGLNSLWTWTCIRIRLKDWRGRRKLMNNVKAVLRRKRPRARTAQHSKSLLDHTQRSPKSTTSTNWLGLWFTLAPRIVAIIIHSFASGAMSRRWLQAVRVFLSAASTKLQVLILAPLRLLDKLKIGGRASATSGLNSTILPSRCVGYLSRVPESCAMVVTDACLVRITPAVRH
jgi:hypothetical protein